MLIFAQPPADAQSALRAAADRVYITPAGTIYLRDHCPVSFIEQLRPDAGLHAFARQPEREYALLLKVARREPGGLALAYTAEGVIVGQITIAHAGAWWQQVEEVCREVAIEVSENWRQQGIAQQLIKLVTAREELENWILLALGFSWHWETAQLGLSHRHYRAMLVNMVAPYGFAEYLTTEPNVLDDPFNILLARLGSRVEPELLTRFYACLLRSDALPGM